MTDRLKVDQTAIFPSNNNQKTILITNINVPERYLNNLDPILTRIDNFLKETYATLNTVYFEISATYKLVHRESGAERDWVGSYNPRFGPLLHETSIFDITFQNTCRRILGNRENIEERLRNFNDLTSEWVFDSLYSIIIHASGFVPRDYHVLYLRNLQGPTRKVINYELP